MEALIYYFAEVFIKNNNYRWKIWDVSKPRTEYNFLPVVETPEGWIYPFEQISTFAIKTFTNKTNNKELYDIYNNLTSP